MALSVPMLPCVPASSLTTLGPRAVLPRPTGLHQLSSLPSYRARFVGQLIVQACQAQEKAVLVDGLPKHLQGPFQPPFHPLSEAGQPTAGCGRWWYEPEEEEREVAVSSRERAKLGATGERTGSWAWHSAGSAVETCGFPTSALPSRPPPSSSAPSPTCGFFGSDLCLQF